MFENNESTGETLSEGSDVAPSSLEESKTTTPVEETTTEDNDVKAEEESVDDDDDDDDESTEESTTQMYFDSLNDAEKQELMDLCTAWAASKGKSSMPGMMKAASPKGNIDFKSIEKEMAGESKEDY